MGFTYAALSFICAVLGLPVAWMVSTSFKQPDELVREIPVWISARPTLDNYVTLWRITAFPRYLLNSGLLAGISTLVATGSAALAAYSLSRHRSRYARAFLITLLVVQMYPSVVLVQPIHTAASRLGLLNSYVALVIVYAGFAVPFATWLLKGYFDSLPRELDEAAVMDGCAEKQVFMKVLLPLAAPGLVAVMLFTFILAWQEYVFALTLTNTDSMRTLSIGLSLLVGQQNVLWGPLMAGAVVATVPVLVFFLYLERYLVQGMTLGAVKG